MQEHLTQYSGSPGHNLEGLEITHLDIEAKEVLIEPGRPHPYLYVVLSGLLEFSIDRPGADPATLMFFMPEHAIALASTLSEACQIVSGPAAPPALALHSDSSPARVQAVRRSQVLQLRADQVSHRVLHDHLWAKFVIVHFLEHRVLMEAHLFDLVLLRRDEHYQKLLDEAPELLAQLRAKQVAALLGITPEALSRIKARLRVQDS